VSEATADIGIIGLGVMGAALAQNFESRGYTVAAYNRNIEVLDGFMAETAGRSFVRCADYQQLAAALKPPRRVILMVTAGRAVDSVLGSLGEVFEEGDIVVDGGNSHYADTDRRVAAARGSGIRFFGMGISGGEEGARLGPAMMPGGDRESFEALRPMLEAAAAHSDSGPCVDWCGVGSAGHFVKMVHNGIEYGDMQLIAEVVTLLREGLGLEPPAVRKVFTDWNAGPLESFLIEITAEIVAAKDPLGSGPLLDQILDVAGQKGTGRWTAIAATEHGVAIPTISSAVDARVLSAGKADRAEAEQILGRSGGALQGIDIVALEDALYAAKICSYTQGFALLQTASAEREYGVDRASVSRIWKAGCIIRARFLDRVYEAFRADPDLRLLLLAPSFAAEMRGRIDSLRAVVGAAVAAGIPVPALSASLAYVDTLSRERGSADVIQAQRDHFGAHTYRRVGDVGVPVHSEWDTLDQL
jgi:6-phosphogluconate dehydrogenase